jgi:hypothetical protein
VPQYHLRRFSAGNRFISLASRDGSRVVPRASIRGQCARHLYYQDDEIEIYLGRLESRHSRVMGAIVDHAWDGGPVLTVLQKYKLREALLLQRNRTPRRASVSASSSDQMILHVFRDYVQHQPQTPESVETLRLIDQGRLSLKSSEPYALLLGLQSAIESVPLTMDLSIHFLRNRTPVPFILGDSPSVFSNHYRRGIEGVGLCGVASRGLMMAMPLDSRTQVLLLDSAVYHAPTEVCVDLEDSADINILNALQVYGAGDCVYFAELTDADYVVDLLSDHPRISTDGLGGFGVAAPVHGSSEDGELLHMYEPAPPITLNLSFVETDDRPLHENVTSVRSPAMVARLDRPRGSEYVGYPLSIERLVNDYRPQVVISEGT